MTMTTVSAADGRMLYGGDYNPEQWPEEIWAKDMELFHEAGINEVTLNVFSWASLQPSEHEYDFSRLDRIVDTVTKAGMSIIMATSTGALPSWLSLEYPEVERVDFFGRKHRQGERHDACPNSPVYRRLSAALAGKLAERYGHLANVVGWHISNEYGGYCYCERCTQAFQQWLRKHYATIDDLNAAWNTAFWSGTFQSFDQIGLPDFAGDGIDGNRAVLPGYTIDYRRFFSDSIREAYHLEKLAVREHDAATPVTTNFMWRFDNYDYQAWGDDLDIASWDCYPQRDTKPSSTAFWHEVIRGLKHGQPFLLMEQTPSRQNWQEYCYLKAPGQMREMSWHAVAHGADSVQFFQLRRSRGGCEKFHGAVIDIDGSNRTRVFREVAQLGGELKRFGSRLLGSRSAARVAVLFDFQNWWGLEACVGPTRGLDYVDECERYFAEFARRNIAVDVVSANVDIDAYAIVLAPCLYMLRGDMADRLRAYVRGGGRLLLTTMSALVDEHDNLFQGECPVPLRDVAGVWAEETDALPPDMAVPLVCGDAPAPADGDDVFGACGLLCDIMHPDDDTRVLARYGGDAFYAGTPAITAHDFGDGRCWYVGTMPDEMAARTIVDDLLDGTGISEMPSPAGTEITVRIAADGTRYTFLLNHTAQSQAVVVPCDGVDLLGDGGAADTPAEVSIGTEITLAPYGVRLIETRA
ncbi:beta-galactosidase [Bifidobacterium ramosum]|uniref:Beta-galactosidase n=1 Tax=Bifidobacterium ramosum TaxID=1798158 RepID=A0A6L4WXU8_9BIFI|nr:beta-galactosidase [Bifidobacterium ramosum]KAB8286885.1 beta-galactosidase [Bifidobacterium ramosum]NEG72593.1 cellulase family glycosylhydrolase [Bifidobacterium ramosum]